MKLKNTLSAAVAAAVLLGSHSVSAQGQGAVEVEAFAKRYFTDSYRNMEDGNLYGGSVGYFLTEDVSLGLSYGEYHRIDSKNKVPDNNTRRKKVNGSLASLDATYHFRDSSDALRPYLSAGFGHQSLSNLPARSGRDRTTMANIGAGAKYYFAENFFARAGVDGMHGLDNNQSEWMAGMGIGLNFGGSSKKTTVQEPAPVVTSEPVYEEPVAAVEPQVVRVELEVLFDFDKAVVKEGSYSDIENLAEFMKQYPELTTTVEGHTDAAGPAAYNQTLSERRADAVRKVMVEQYGVDADRVSSVGYGESQPIADNATREGRSLNRRVEAVVEAHIE